MAAPSTVEEYLAALPDEQRAVLEELRAAIATAAPEAAETISYQMPTFTQGGRLLVSYAAFKRHYSVFPASEAVRDALGSEVAPYVAGQGTLRFPAGRPIPFDLVTKVVAVRLKEIAGGGRR